MVSMAGSGTAPRAGWQMEIRAGEAGRTAGFKCGEGGFGDGSGLSERSLPWEMTPLVPSQPPALIFIPVSPKHPPCGSGGEHLLHMSSMQCQALALQPRLSVLAGLKQSPWLFCLRASLPGVAPWQCLVHFAEGAMPGAHPQSHHGHAAVAWNHRGPQDIPGGVCVVSESPRKMETPSLLRSLGSAARQRPL